MNKIITEFGLLLIISTIISACTYSFDISDLGGMDSPKVVLNSVLNPDSAACVYVNWSKYIYDKGEYQNVNKFDLKLWENDELVLDTMGVAGICKSNFFPQEGKEYRIEIEVPEYGTVSSKTNIPYCPVIDIEFKKFVKAGHHATTKGYHFYEIKKIEQTTPIRSLMIMSRGYYEGYIYIWNEYFYLNSNYCDGFNAYINSEDAIAKESNTEYEFFVRIPSAYFKEVSPLSFSFGSFRDGLGYYDHEIQDVVITNPLKEIQLLLMAPSDDYDLYMKSVKEQKDLSYIEPPIFVEVKPVHQNIINGCGIFAGYSCLKIKVEILQ